MEQSVQEALRNELRNVIKARYAQQHPGQSLEGGSFMSAAKTAFNVAKKAVDVGRKAYDVAKKASPEVRALLSEIDHPYSKKAEEGLSAIGLGRKRREAKPKKHRAANPHAALTGEIMRREHIPLAQASKMAAQMLHHK